MGTPALIGLGSNLGDRKAHLDRAVAALSQTPGVALHAVSAYHTTAPVGGPGGQEPFLNAAAAIETTLDALDLLHRLQTLEQQAGRVRDVRWGARSLDLDLLLYGDRTINTGHMANGSLAGSTGELIVPHPLMRLRRFVLTPAAEVAPKSIDPVTGQSIAALLANLDRRPGYVAFHHSMMMVVEALIDGLAAKLGAAAIRHGRDYPLGPRNGLQPWSQSDAHLQRYQAWLDRVSHDLDPRHRDSQREDNAWVLSDFWFDEELAPCMAYEPLRAGLLQQVHEARRHVLRPTFVVATVGWSESAARLVRSLDPSTAVPVLEVAHGDPEAALETIRTTCAATRAG